MSQYAILPVPRPGAFAANFSPDTLNRFRDLCKQQGRQYTKVLERLAEMYLETGGAVIEGTVVPSASLTSFSGNASIALNELQEVLKRVEQIEVEYKKADAHLMSLIQALTEKQVN